MPILITGGVPDMDFWESFSKTVSEAAEYTAREAGKLTGIAKLKYKISTCKARLNNLFESLGRLKYDELKGNAASETYSYDELVDKIDKVKAELESYENDLAKLKNERLCVSCRAVIGLDMTFCPRCAAKQPEPEKRMSAAATATTTTLAVATATTTMLAAMRAPMAHAAVTVTTPTLAAMSKATTAHAAVTKATKPSSNTASLY